MACIVYREGTGTIEHGIECESTVCEIGELHSLLSAGWLPDPPGYVAPEPVIDEEEEGDLPVNNSDDPDEALIELMEEIEGLRKELELRIGIEENLSATIEQLKADLAKARKPAEPAAALEAAEENEDGTEEQDGEDLNPVRAAGRDAGIEGWETMHLTSLKKAVKDKAQEA